MSTRLLRWALRNAFRIDDAQWIFETWPAARSLAVTLSADRLMREIAMLQKNDVRYWSPIIGELREMRRNGELLPEGARI